MPTHHEYDVITYVMGSVVEYLLPSADHRVSGVNVAQSDHILLLLGDLVVTATRLLETVVWGRGSGQVRSGQVKSGPGHGEGGAEERLGLAEKYFVQRKQPARQDMGRHFFYDRSLTKAQLFPR